MQIGRRENGLFFQEWIWPLEARWLSLRWNGATGCGVIESPWWPCGPINLSFRRWSAVMQCIVLQGRLSCFMGIFCHGWSSHHILSWHPKLWYYSCPSIMRFFLTWVAWITQHLEAMMKRCFSWEQVQPPVVPSYVVVLSRKKKVRWSWTDLQNWIFLYASFLAMTTLDEKRWSEVSIGIINVRKCKWYHIVAMFWYILHHFALSISNFPRSQGNWSSIATHLCGSWFSRALTSYASSFVTATAIETRRRSMGMWLVGLVGCSNHNPASKGNFEAWNYNLKV